MIKINKSNYEFYKQVFKVIWKFQAKYSNIDPNVEYSPINVLSKWEKQSESLARKGLKEGLRDTLSELMYLSAELLTELNNDLIFNNFPTVAILTSQIKNLPQKVLKKGKIKNLDEYYVIKEVLDNVEYELSQIDRIKLSDIFGEFEKEYVTKNTE